MYELAAALIGAIVGSLATFLLQKRSDADAARKRTQSNRDALFAEIQVCAGFAETYMTANILAPLYRLPTTCFQISFGQLLREGELSDAASDALIKFYSEVDTFNRGLDLTAAITTPPVTVGKQTIDDAYGRNRMKAAEIRNTSGKLYLAVLDAFKRGGPN